MPEHPTRSQAPQGNPTPTDAPGSTTGEPADGTRHTLVGPEPWSAAGVAPPPGYELLEEVGRGGMGVVFRARDTSLSRDVAVKLLQDRYPATGPAARRFLDEAAITSQLQHPGIPPVHQVGTLPDGRPFLAMKLIKGRTLAELLDERPAAADDRARFLGIFEQVCLAVGYAHSCGVIHRDLKPANVMVGKFGEVQVMDWGLAKVLGTAERADPDAAGTTVRTVRGLGSDTQAGAVLGTPAFMPPEQAGGEVEKIDRRSDVFALGGILCVILTGRPPYTGKDSNDVHLKAIRGQIGEALAALDSCGAEPELVALGKRCLATDPGRRPADGGEVAAAVAGFRAAAEQRARQAELDRVRAEGELRAAELRAAEQRKKRRAWFVVAATLLVGAAASAALAYRAEQARGRADEALHDLTEEEARTRAALARATAEERRATTALARVEAEHRRTTDALAESRAVLAFLTDDVLAQASPSNSRRGQKPTIDEVFHLAAARIDGKFPDRPAVEAAVRHTVGEAFREIGDAKAAEPHLERAWALRKEHLGPDDPETLRTQVALARVYRNQGHTKQARPLVEEALARATRAAGPDHRVTFDARYNLARLDQQDGHTARAGRDLERLVADMSRALGPEDPDTLQSLYALFTNYLDEQKTAEAERALARLLPAARRRLGEDHLITLVARGHAVGELERKGDFRGAAELWRDIWTAQKQRLGPDHRHTLSGQSFYADALVRVNQQPEADRLYRDLADRARRAFAPDNADRYEFVGRFGAFLRWTGRPAEAEAPLREAYEGAARLLGPGAAETTRWLERLISVYQELGRPDRAEPFAAEAVRLARARTPDQLADSLTLLGDCQMAGRKAADAEKTFRELLAMREKEGPKLLVTADVRARLAEALTAQKKFAEAEPLLLAAFDTFLGRKRAFEARPGVERDVMIRRWVEIHSLIGRLYAEWGKPGEVARWRKRRSELPPEPAPPPREVKK